MEQPVQSRDYMQLELDRGGVRVVLQFPNQSEQGEILHDEVKEILSNLLQEQIAQMKCGAMEKKETAT